MKQKICDITVLQDQEAQEFCMAVQQQQKDGFVFAFAGQYFAYENSCPHTGANLNWQPAQFFSLDGLYLQCSLHGALFEPQTGLCVRGPCRGQRLKKIELEQQDNGLYVKQTD